MISDQGAQAICFDLSSLWVNNGWADQGIGRISFLSLDRQMKDMFLNSIM